MIKKTLLTFYGDDFTGTTATAETLTEIGIPTLIFTKTPSVSFLANNFPKIKAIGIAGIARTLSTDKLENELVPIFKSLKSHKSPIFLYKICSTFDSSKRIGNIGKAIEIGKRIFSSPFIPVLPAAPKLGRFTIFGNHFAALGEERIFRLDRHPSMANHPITPMNESDLLLHLAQQTKLGIGLVNIFDVKKGIRHIKTLLEQFIKESTPIVFFDCLDEKQLTNVCEVIFQTATPEKPMFFVGSQEIGYGLGKIWRRNNLIPPRNAYKHKKNASQNVPILILSGSCAEVTGKQIIWAAKNGFMNIEIQPQKLIDYEDKSIEQERIFEISVKELRQGNSVLLHTAIGLTDYRKQLMKRKMKELSIGEELANEILGNALGEILLRIIKYSKIRRIVIAGGDTSGRIQKHLSIQAMQVAKSIGFAAPLCYIYSSLPYLNGMEIAFKGGQIGSIDYFKKAFEAKTVEFEKAAFGHF